MAERGICTALASPAVIFRPIPHPSSFRLPPSFFPATAGIFAPSARDCVYVKIPAWLEFPAIDSEVHYRRQKSHPFSLSGNRFGASARTPPQVFGIGSLWKGTTVNRSLTVLLPVRDAQSTLAATVTEILEMASDLSERFELLIIDDGSSDATSEVAQELSRHYPQIRTFRHGQPLGEEAALRCGLAQSRGDVVLVRDGPHPTFERISWSSQPVRPNYLGRTRNFAREGL